MSKHIGHHITIDEDVFVDSNFLNQLRSIDISLSHIWMGDFECDVDGVNVQFRRRDGSMETPEGFVGRPHYVYSANNATVSQVIEKMITNNSTEEV